LVRETVPVVRSTGYSTVPRNGWPFQSSGIGSALVIPSAEIEIEELLMINEDTNVMSRILETNLRKAQIPLSGGGLFARSGSYGSLVNILSSRGGTGIQGLYLQGYGVLFLMRVDFPLSPSKPTREPDEAEKQQDGDEVWKDMRRQLYEPEKVVERKGDETTAKYDPKKVEYLKATVVNTLKHAANIRSLKPEESVILTVRGGGKSAGVSATAVQRYGKTTTTRQFIVHDKKRGLTKIVEGDSLDDLGLSSPTVLVIRAKKEDINSFSKGDLNLEQFRQRVQMLSYPLLDGAIASEGTAAAVRDALTNVRYRSAR
jgi:hypothetical protein